jgi:pimeloyl-ACP methyl ester carboxylesterase
VRDLEVVREHFGARKVALIGWSYMGLLVALYASRHADRVTRVVQIDPVPMEFDATYPRELSEPYETGVDTVALKGLDSLRRTGYDKAHPKAYCEKDWDVNRFALVGERKNVARLTVNATAMCRLQNEWPINLDRHIAASIASIKPFHWSPADLGALTMPFLTIHGTRDRNAPYGGGREWAIKLPNARLFSVRGAAHSSFDEYPEIVLPAVETFLGGAWPASAARLHR